MFLIFTKNVYKITGRVEIGIQIIGERKEDRGKRRRRRKIFDLIGSIGGVDDSIFFRSS